MSFVALQRQVEDVQAVKYIDLNRTETVKVAGFVAFDKKKVARRMICLCYNQCLKWGKKVAVLSLHWQICKNYIFTVKNKTWRYCCYNNLLLFIY